ncbi:S26 family signal peptidase [Actinomadura kijaniata]|uniref:S26 family signal peptidase n=1 Tax=Actinomadura kijaniata TaxID=46161 RepID=UPI003F1D3D15
MRAAGALALALAAAVWLLRRRYLVITVDGSSMSPAHRPGDRLLVRRSGAVGRGQVVVFADRWRQWTVKRVAAAPGDPVPRDLVPALRDVPETHVPPGLLVLLGDNAEDSYDSRHYGYVPVTRLFGPVVRPLNF